MLRVLNLYIPIASVGLAFLDTMVLALALWVSLTVSQSWNSDLVRPFGSLVLFSSAAVLSLFVLGAYQRRALASLANYAPLVLVAQAAAFGMLMVVFYLFPASRIGIGALIPAMAISTVGLIGLRFAITRTPWQLGLRRRLLVIGTGQPAARIEAVEHAGARNFVCLGFVPFGQEATRVSPERIIRSNDILGLCGSHGIDEVVVAVPRQEFCRSQETLLRFRMQKLCVIDAETFFEMEFGQCEIDSNVPDWLLFSNGSTIDGFEAFLKRAFDVVTSLAVLVATLPVMLATAAAIWLEDRGPMLYRQQRIGLNGKPFDVIKFRSMRVDAEKDGKARWADRRDPRITRVGAFTRKYRLDELPQVFNVLRGEMSFVGPRPERPSIVDQLIEHIGSYPCRHVVKPGITGWAQINYQYGASVDDAKEKLKFDFFYIKNFTLVLDVIILLQTIRVVLWPQGVR